MSALRKDLAQFADKLRAELDNLRQTDHHAAAEVTKLVEMIEHQDTLANIDRQNRKVGKLMSVYVGERMSAFLATHSSGSKTEVAS